MRHDYSSVTCIARSNDGLLLATWDANGDVKALGLETDSCLRTISACPGQSICTSAFLRMGAPDAACQS